MSISSGSLITREYSGLRGVDFANDPGMVSLQRSPDALNVWKNYKSSQGNCIETRPGYKEVISFISKINAFFIFSSTKALVHSGKNLYLWDNFPSNEEDPVILKSDMNDCKSTMYMFGKNLYINDGLHFLKYDGNVITNVSNEAYVPTTSIGRKPSGGGQINEDINILSSQRINTFLADGSSTDYYLDSTGVSSIDKITINDSETTDFTVNLQKGKVTFNTAPTKPSIMGQDNIAIKFTKQIEGYKERILNCKIAKVFDNRIFFSGNSNFPNAIFHCVGNNPAYISDLDYYQDGIETPIKDLVVGNNSLWVLKESNQNKDTIFYHTPNIDVNYGVIYPSSQGNVSIGCYVSGFNYDDTIVFLSREGLESITASIDSLQMVTHKSSLVDNKLINSSNYQNAVMERWNGYLIIAVDDEIYLADNRAMFSNKKNYEFEWFYWKLQEKVTILREWKGRLFFGTNTGKICEFKGTNDNSAEIESYWTTPRDTFSYMQFLKTSNKRGAVAKVKNIQNSRIKIEVQTNKKNWKTLKESSTSGFNFSNIDFANFSFGTKDNSYIAFKIKVKKIIDYQIKFSSIGKDKPFGLYSCVLEAFVGSFVKRS